MKKILILGAGRSSHHLIGYLLAHAPQQNWQLTIGDFDQQAAQEKIKGHETRAKAIFFDAKDTTCCEQHIGQTDLVVSLLPPALHIHAAKACIKLNKSMFTASYVSPEIKALDAEAKAKGLLLMNELGLDPGIDHLSAMKIIHHLQAQGAEIQSFKSYTGGLIAPAYDTNPWNYKFTWNPRNVVLAGQGTARYIQNGSYKYVPYHRLFQDVVTINVANYGNFDGYPNRDSLSYRSVYGLDTIPTMIRGTLRKQGFCQAWDTFVQLGMTDDSFKMENSENLTYRDFLHAFLPELPSKPQATTEEKLAAFLKETPQGTVYKKIEWLGLFATTQANLPQASPAQLLQHLLESKWQLAPQDQDMIVMQHLFEYQLGGKNYQLTSSMVAMGDDPQATAMSKTVGLPLAIGAKLFLEGKINLTGVHIPIQPALYEPILAELETLGITFVEC